MPYVVPIEDARSDYPQFDFIAPLTPSEQKAAFHVRDSEGRDLCLKLIAPTSDIDRVTREFEGLRRTDHPNVVGVIEYTFSTGPEGRRHHILEEFVAGSDLADHLLAGPWERSRAKQFFLELLDGLAALADEDIVHRDLKPHNVRVTPDDSPVIIDFGLIRQLNAPDLTETRLGARIGTPIYFAPEQFRGGKRDIDPRTDLFACGVLLHQALVASHPFYVGGMTIAQIDREVCESMEFSTEPAFRALPKPWQVFVTKLLAKDRLSRFASASQARDLLRRLEP